MYERARHEIEAAGLTLIQDEVSDQELAYEAFAADIQKNSPFDEPSADLEAETVEPEAAAEPAPPEPSMPAEALPFELPEITDDVLGDPFEAPTLDDLPDLSEQESEIPTMENASSMEPEPELESEEADTAFEQRILSFPSRPASEESTLDAEDDAPEPMDVEEEAPPELAIPEPEPEVEVAESVDAFFEAEPEETGPTQEEEISGILDAACEALSNENSQEGLNEFGGHVRELQARADEAGWDGAAAACRSVVQLLEMLDRKNIEPNDRFLELAYGFSGVYVESRESADTDEYKSFQHDCVTLLQEWMEDRPPTDDAPMAEPVTEPVAAAAPIASPEVEGSDPALANLLDTVRAAMQGGRAANAKLLMLEAAARIAHEQEGEAAKLVGEAERALNENSRALEEARNSVQKHEARVSETAAKVSDVQHGQEDHRRQALLIAERLEECRGRVDSLDEQIRELQNRRADAENERLAAEDELNAARASEDEHETELEAMRNEEREARLRLEEERGRAKTLQNSRSDLERAVLVKREMLARQRQSTHDIEQTIAHTRDAEAGESTEDHDSLF